MFPRPATRQGFTPHPLQDITLPDITPLRRANRVPVRKVPLRHRGFTLRHREFTRRKVLIRNKGITRRKVLIRNRGITRRKVLIRNRGIIHRGFTRRLQGVCRIILAPLPPIMARHRNTRPKKPFRTVG